MARADDSRTSLDSEEVDASENTNRIVQLDYLKDKNLLVALNGDQNAFVYELDQDKREVRGMKLVASHCLYLDEIIDAKFVDENKQAILCSNSESLKLMDTVTGVVELYQGHTDIIITVDFFEGFIISGAKDNEIRLWTFNPKAERYRKLKCIAVF